MSFNKIPLFTALLSIFMLFSCSSASVVADEKELASSGSPKGQIGRLLVPAAPNQSIVKGTVSAYCEISSRLLNIRPEMVIYKITVLVESSGNIEGYSDFTRGKEGREIELLTKQKPPSGLYGNKIKARVTFRGDARRSSYWIRHLEVIE